MDNKFIQEMRLKYKCVETSTSTTKCLKMRWTSSERICRMEKCNLGKLQVFHQLFLFLEDVLEFSEGGFHLLQ